MNLFTYVIAQYLVFATVANPLLGTLSKNDEQSKEKTSFKLCISALYSTLRLF